MNLPMVLASASPRRRDLLAAMGYRFRVVAPDVDETIRAGADPAEEAERLAVAKALAVAERVGPAVVIAADTLCSLDGHILGKPLDREDARAAHATRSSPASACSTPAPGAASARASARPW